MKTANSDNLFTLIRQRTLEGKINWTGSIHRLEGLVPGTPLRLELEYNSDQREGDWHLLTVWTSGNNPVQCGTEAELAALRKYIIGRPASGTVAEATEILESL
jgi:hypothetical protein